MCIRDRLLKEERVSRLRKIKAFEEKLEDIPIALKQENAWYVGKYDALLDKGDFGPIFLKQPKIANIVTDCIQYWHQQERYKLICYSVMPNHVHLMLYQTKLPLYKILQTIKTYTATEANILLDRTGKAFWHPESYDNLVRNLSLIHI